MIRRTAVFITTILLTSTLSAAIDPVMPPEIRWSGKSVELAVPASHEWATPFEKSGLVASPRYGETVSWLRRIEKATPSVRLVSIGKSPEGRDLWMAVVSAEGASTPKALTKNGKPTIFVQGGIHSGEIDGKDAGMMLLRDMTVRGTKRSLLGQANLIFLPIFNVDGHERSSAYSRINQRGPSEMGWRTTAQNLNLNRDYAKIDAPEMQHIVRALTVWKPDLYIDVHVTDGVDYQYDVTWGFSGPLGYSPSASKWMSSVLTPAAERDLTAMGHIPGRLVFAVDSENMSKGISGWVAPPRFSNGYGDARHLPAILVENHSLKPFAQRVFGTYVLIESFMNTMGSRGNELRSATREDRTRNTPTVPIEWKATEGKAPQMIDFLGIESTIATLPSTGAVYTQYTGKPVTIRIPFNTPDEVSKSIDRPSAYWIDPAWTEVIARLQLHGVQMERMTEPRTVDVTMYRFESPVWEKQSFEGRVRVTATAIAEKRRETYPAGSVRVATNQPLGDLAVLLLEPASGDSFFQWGFFNAVLEQKEYVETYIMAPTAEKMLADDPKLRAEFEEKLRSDSAFRDDVNARVNWFYRRTPYYDQRIRLYPVGREE